MINLHTKMYFMAFQLALQCRCRIRLQTINNVREKIPFLWFVGNISVLKFCGCPAETGAKISLILFRLLNNFVKQFKTEQDQRWQQREGREIIEHSVPCRCYLTPLGNLCFDERCFSNYELYIIPKGAIKPQVKSLLLKRYKVMTQVNRDLGVSSIYKGIYVVHNLWIHDFANSANIIKHYSF